MMCDEPVLRRRDDQAVGRRVWHDDAAAVRRQQLLRQVGRLRGLEPHHRGDELLGVARRIVDPGRRRLRALDRQDHVAAGGQRDRREADREQGGVQDLERLGRADLVLEHDRELAAQRVVIDEARARRARHRLDHRLRLRVAEVEHELVLARERAPPEGRARRAAANAWPRSAVRPRSGEAASSGSSRGGANQREAEREAALARSSQAERAASRGERSYMMGLNAIRLLNDAPEPRPFIGSTLAKSPTRLCSAR